MIPPQLRHNFRLGLAWLVETWQREGSQPRPYFSLLTQLQAQHSRKCFQRGGDYNQGVRFLENEVPPYGGKEAANLRAPAPTKSASFNPSMSQPAQPLV